jgi:hypothetical protein
MKQKMVWMAALAVAVIGLDLSVATDVEAQMLRRLGRRNNCCSDCCQPAVSNCGDCGTAVASYEAAPMSYEAAPVSYEAAPMSYEMPMESSDCGCAQTTDCGCGEATPVSYEMASDCGGCGEVAPVSYEVVEGGCVGCENSSTVTEGAGCPQGGCGEGEVVYETAAPEAPAVVEEATIAPAEETSTTVEAPAETETVAPEAPAEEVASEEDREA